MITSEGCVPLDPPTSPGPSKSVPQRTADRKGQATLAVRGLYLLIPLLMAAECDENIVPPEELVRPAVLRWIGQGFPFTATCASEETEVRFIWTDNAPRDCGSSKPDVVGCSLGTRVWLDISLLSDAQEYNRVVEHELRHWLSGCGYGNRDSNHSRPYVWSGLL